MRIWLALIGSALLFVAAAKAHGRQLRLERELDGQWQVAFGGANPPEVEARWRRDRVRFWVLTPLLALVALGYVALARQHGWPLGSWGAGALAAVLWAPTGTFAALGLVSLSRLSGALADHSRNGAGRLVGQAREAWAAEVACGNLGWWALVAALAAGLFALGTSGSSLADPPQP